MDTGAWLAQGTESVTDSIGNLIQRQARLIASKRADPFGDSRSLVHPGTMLARRSEGSRAEARKGSEDFTEPLIVSRCDSLGLGDHLDERCSDSGGQRNLKRLRRSAIWGSPEVPFKELSGRFFSVLMPLADLLHDGVDRAGIGDQLTSTRREPEQAKTRLPEMVRQAVEIIGTKHQRGLLPGVRAREQIEAGVHVRDAICGDRLRHGSKIPAWWLGDLASKDGLAGREIRGQSLERQPFCSITSAAVLLGVSLREIISLLR